MSESTQTPSIPPGFVAIEPVAQVGSVVIWQVFVGALALASVVSLVWAAWRWRHQMVAAIMALWRARIPFALIAANSVVIIFGLDMTERMVRREAPNITAGVLLILVPLLLIHLLALRASNKP